MRLRLPTAIFARTVSGADDRKLERRFGSAPVQWAIFKAMTSRFDADAARGFQGKISYELQRPATGGVPLRWTVEVGDGKARARRGGAEDAALKLRLTLADFVRIGAGTVDPALPVLQGRASFQGDFGLAVRLPEMFGASSPRR
jgi:putative sterol carrier protein